MTALTIDSFSPLMEAGRHAVAAWDGVNISNGLNEDNYMALSEAAEELRVALACLAVEMSVD